MSRAVKAKWMQLYGAVFSAVVLMGLSGLATAQGNAAAGESKITTCVACHGATGNDSQLADVPSIGGQHAKYLLKQMQDIKSGSREIPLMAGMLDAFSEADLADIAAYYAAQEAPRGAADPDKVALGESLYRAGNASIGVAACTACHAPSGKGNVGAGYPSLSGQDVAYTVMQLKAFREGSRNNDDAAVMRSISERLTDREIEALASFVSGLR